MPNNRLSEGTIMPFAVSLPLTFLSLLLFALIGCGEKTGVGTGVIKLEASRGCIDCHGARVSSVTGIPVADEWKKSSHNTANGAGCADCHEPEAGHPNSCNLCHGGAPSSGTAGSANDVSNNPDRDGKCGKCHSSAGGYRNSVYGNMTNDTRVNHFSTPLLAAYTSGAYKARYVTRNYEKSCRSCHNPHDTSSRIEKYRQWARSGKGDVTASPWASRTFRKLGTNLPATPATSFGSECVRCHTTTGFITYLKDKTIAPYGGPSETEGREILGCNACHDDGAGNAYSYKVRGVGQITAYYNLSTTQAGASPSQPNRYRIRIPQTFMDIKTSNVCLACHVGREIGKMIQVVAAQGADFSNLGFVSSHFLTGGASIFQVSGYEFSGRTYPSGQSTPDSFPYLHGSVGVNNQNGTGYSGPCVTCHLKPGRHTFLPVGRAEDPNPWLRQVTAISSPECVKCHDGSTANAVTVVSLNTAKSDFYAALTVLKTMLEAKGLYYRSGSIFNAATGSTRVTNWVMSPSSGPDIMGATFNYVLLNYDFGAYVHNVFYAKRLLYDSIDLIDDGTLNFSTCASIGMGNTAAFECLCANGITNSFIERP
jgi:hypothetical protein